jgi:methylated-DNA-protein-cysteine methyltransferase-like protein
VSDREGFEPSVLAVLERLPPGEVVTYGEVAAEAGFPGAARAVGNLLRSTGHPVPWWRVVTADGRLVPRAAAEQRRRLAAEGVVFTRSGRVADPQRRRGGSP